MRRALQKLGVDRAIFLTVLGRGWSLCAGLFTVGFVTHFLSPVAQGFYYTFYSLIALQLFVEMGLTFVIAQLASHEVAHLTWSQQGVLEGNDIAKSRLQSLLKFAMAWFGGAALLALVLLSTAGLHFFTSTSNAIAHGPDVAAPWLLLVLFAAANLVVTALVALIEGCGKVVDVAKLRLCQSVFTALPLWVVLSLGGGLYALSASSLAVAAVGVAWLTLKYRRFLVDLWRHPNVSSGMRWRTEIWPFQWRIAISWSSGYLAFQFVTPYLFSTQGPVAAGQMGMSLQIISAMNGAVMVWITTKIPLYGSLVARREFVELNRSFSRALRQSLGLLVACIVIGLLLLWRLQATGFAQAARVLPVHLMAALCIGAIANHVSGAEGTYLRTFKKDPFMPLSIASGIGTVLLTLLLVPKHGIAGAAMATTTIAVCIGLIGGSLIFWKKRIEYTRAQ